MVKFRHNNRLNFLENWNKSESESDTASRWTYRESNLMFTLFPDCIWTLTNIKSVPPILILTFFAVTNKWNINVMSKEFLFYFRKICDKYLDLCQPDMKYRLHEIES